MASIVEKRGSETIYRSLETVDIPNLDLLSFLFEKWKAQERHHSSCRAEYGIREGDTVQDILTGHILCPSVFLGIMAAGATVAYRILYFGDSEDMELYEVKSDVQIHVSSDKHRWTHITDTATRKKTTTCIVYIGGTTGPPKAIPISQANIVASVLLFMEPCRCDPDIEFRMIAHVPTAHLSGILGYITSQTYAGGTVFWMTKFGFPQLMAHCKRYSATTLLSPPRVWLAVAKAPFVTDQLNTMITAFSSGAPMGAKLQSAAQRKLGGGQLGQMWGMSETSGPMTVLPLREKDDTGSVAMLVANSEMRIADEKGRDVEPGVAGEAWVRGPQVVAGYFKNEKATRESFVDGWHRTGDLLYFEDGKFYFVDRAKEIIHYEGRRVIPAHLESILTTHPQIQDAEVIGVTVDGDEVPRAYIVADESKASERDIQSWLTPTPTPAMPNDRDQRYDAVPPIPSYDEAMSNANHADWPPPASPNPETESHSLLSSRNNAASSSRRPGGYRSATVETDDEDSLFDSSDDGDETAYVRREMQELEMDDAGNSRSSIWGKRIPFSLSLPNWKWSWRPRLPRLRRTIILPQGPSGDSSTAEGDASSNQETTQPRIRWPSFDGLNGKQAAIVLVRVFAGFLVLSFVYLIFMSDIFSTMARRFGTGLRFDPEDVRMWVQGHVENAAMLKTVKHYTSFAHIAGTEGDYGYAMDMETMFHRAGMDSVHIDQYQVYLNYPKANGRAVEILDKDGEKATWKAKMEEKEVGGEIAGHQTFSFHGHSKAGDVKGPLVYANYGSREDFALLKDKEINTEGAIALVRYYGSQPDLALKVKAAEEAGFVGCLVYSDPEDDGFRQGDVAPAGRFMPEDGVQRGSVSLTNMVIGDVLTPGWGSKEGLPRMKVEQTPGLVKIPSLPLAWRDAQVLLQHLKGAGQKVPEEWKGGVPDVEEWWTGDASSPIVRLKNEQDEEKKQPIWNVYGKIEGIEQTEKTIMIGNHRDAWAFGATDPHTGTAVMLEVARLFGILLRKGWRPLRTIEFMSWDGEAYNMIGSTEFVETHVEKLRENGCAYINLGGAVAGGELHASGSPVFRSVLNRILERIEDPHHNMTLRELWDKRGGEIEGPSVVGDAVPFLDIAGTSTLDLSFRGDPHPQYSSYDNFDWMKRMGDPGFIYHGLMAQVVAFLCLELADRPIMPFDTEAYAIKLEKWAEDLTDWSKEKIKAAGQDKTFSLDPIKIAIHEVKSAAKTFSRWENTWDSVVMGGGGWESAGMNTKRIEYNSRMAGFETALLDIEQGGGIPKRTQFKHVVLGPQAWSNTKQVAFPAIRDAIEDADWDSARKLVDKTANLIRNAANVLLDQHSDAVPGR
ncbi:hypothetical protein ACHAQH_007112 [Verticillium albo-atrum]